MWTMAAYREPPALAPLTFLGSRGRLDLFFFEVAISFRNHVHDELVLGPYGARIFGGHVDVVLSDDSRQRGNGADEIAELVIGPGYANGNRLNCINCD